MLNEYVVTVGEQKQSFLTLNEAKSYAEKISWDLNLPAEIRCPDGRTLKVKVGNVP
jgi:hypothetical protein